MGIPEDVKENVRAVLLSKTDGSGILVSTFLKDYKAIIHRPLFYKDMGYGTLEQFIKDIPDVCRLEYSDKEMAFKLFGIAKPNTYVSSFVRRAEGGTEEPDTGRNGGRKLENVRPTNDLNEKWEPNLRGVYTLCFPNKSGNGLESKDAVAMKFAQLGEVVEINIIHSRTFVRFRDEKVAKKAVALFGDELRLRRADEKVMNKSGGRSRDKRQSGDSSGSDSGHSANRGGRKQGLIASPESSNGLRSGKREEGRRFASDLDDENWDDDGGHGDQQQNRSGYKGLPAYQQNHSSVDNSENTRRAMASSNSVVSDSNRNLDDRPRGVRNSQMATGDGHYPKQNTATNKSESRSTFTQVYIGNWPSDATENELRQLIKPYDCEGCRLLHAKDSKMKKFAFVDFCDEVEAQRLIGDLNNSVYKGRDLQCRLGNRGGHSVATPHSPKGSIEKDFEQLSLHKSTPRQNQVATKSEAMSPKIPKKPLLESPKMPALEVSSMPPLESASFSPRQMPPLENSRDFCDEMPPLEKVMSPAIPASFDRRGLRDMPKLEQMSPGPMLNGAAGQSANSPVQLNIGNFPYGTVEEELMMVFCPYGAHKITLMNTSMVARSTYAFADFADVTDALNAMDNLDQSLFKGRKLVVTLSNPGGVLQQQNMSMVPNLTCTVTEKRQDEGRSVHVKGMPQLSPFSDGLEAERAYEQSLQPNRSNFNYQRLTTTLQEYTKLSTKLRADEMFQMVEGMTLRVMITHVENARFFWAQIENDSINGVNRGLLHLERLDRDMQMEPKTETSSGLGRCMASFENRWYRAWCTFLTEKNGIPVGDVIFIDYGNRAFTPKSELIRTKTGLWSLPPMARPFKLVEPKYDLDKYVNQKVNVEVLEPGSHRTNSLATVRAYWM